MASTSSRSAGLIRSMDSEGTAPQLRFGRSQIDRDEVGDADGIAGEEPGEPEDAHRGRRRDASVRRGRGRLRGADGGRRIAAGGDGPPPSGGHGPRGGGGGGPPPPPPGPPPAGERAGHPPPSRI